MSKIKIKTIFLLLLISINFNYSKINSDEKPVGTVDTIETLMVVNFIRHGNRTPGKIFKEIKSLFHQMDTKKLTLTGFKQMNILGKYIRKLYIDSKKLKINQESISHEYLIISSPSQRSIDSSIAYSLGLFPDKIFKFYDFNNKNINREASPPILLHYEDVDYLNHLRNSKDYYNLVIDNKNKNTLFHAKKCIFGSKQYPKNKDFQHLTQDDKKEAYKYFQTHFPQTLKNIEVSDLNDKMARSIYSSMRCVNKHYRKQFVIPKNLEANLKRMLTVYNYFVKISNDEASKLMSSSFFDHLIKFFDNRIKWHLKKNKIYTNDNFYQALLGDEINTLESLEEFLPRLENEDYSQLKLVTYSGHDGNLTSLIRNFLYERQIWDYFKNFEAYKSLLYISFASNIDFNLNHLAKENKYYVKIFINGKEPFERVRSYLDGEYLTYDEEKGIEYSEFRQLIVTRIHEDISKCEFREN